MKKLIISLLVSTGCFAQTYIANVSVLDVEKHKLIPNHTVVILGDKISEVKSGVKIPARANVIDGKGKFLIPGLVDSHVHFFQSGGLYTRPDAIDLREVRPYAIEIERTKSRFENVLRRYLKNGITTVIDPGAPVNFLKLRDKSAGSDIAPKVFMSGPLLTTYLPEVYKDLGDDSPFDLVLTPEAGREGVRRQAAFKPDFIKIWYIANVDNLSPAEGARKYLPTIQAIIDESHKLGLKVAVHATERLTAQLAVENGCDYLVHSIEDELVSDDFVKLIKQKNVILCPTLVVHQGYLDTFGQRLDITAYEIKSADPFQLGSLLDLKHLKLKDSTLIGRYFKAINTEETNQRLKTETEILYKNLKKLTDAGIVIATGTDAGNIGTLHASSYLDEILAMQKAGMTNWQIIQASTINGAKILNKQSEFGSIAKGKKANLILLDANPIENLEDLTKIYRIIVNGVVLDPEKILPETPEELVQRQLNAYNFRNLDAFLATYSDDVAIYNFPDTPMSKGKENMKGGYATMFGTLPELHCELKNRIVTGNYIFDHEHVTFGKGDAIQAGALYYVENGKIKTVHFTR